MKFSLRKLYFIALLSSQLCFGQNWIGVGNGMNRGVWAMFADTVEDELLVGGFFKDVDSSFVAMGLTKWDGTSWIDMGCGLDWDCIGPLSQNAGAMPPTSFIRYQGDLYMGGRFTMVNGDSIPYLARWDGNAWQEVGGGLNALVMDMAVIDDTLYVVGGFTEAGGITTGGIARWDGNNWYDGYGFSQTWQQVNCIAEYQGDIYVAGNFNFSIFSELAKWDGSSWTSPGGGIQGSLTTVWDLEVYNNRLYVGGNFTPPANAGTGIMAWDGSQWDDLQGGLYSPLLLTGTCWDMTIWNNELVVGGGFRAAGGVPSENIAVWNDTQWCVTGDTLFTFSHTIHNVAVYHDSLFIGGNWTYIGGERLPKIAKYNGTSISQNCSLPNGIEEEQLHTAQISVYPNPSNGIVNIRSSEWLQNAELRVLDLLGREIFRTTFSGVEHSIDLSTLPIGMYLLGLDVQNGSHQVIKLFLE